MYRLYDLLPAFYHVEDEKQGYHLRDFLEVLQTKLDEIYEDEKKLRLIQDPDHCREDFLDWIALSLAWKYIHEETPSRRVEAKEIVNFYDLKGTPYAMRLLSRLTFGSLFQRLYEFYDGHPASISTIRTNYENMPYWFRYLIEGNGIFPVSEWKEARVQTLGRPYGFDRDRRYYSYCVYLRVMPNEYDQWRGKIRPRYERFIRNYRTFHPAGRFCYVYITMPYFRPGDEVMGGYLLGELVGTLHWDAFQFDRGLHYDAEANPVHESISYVQSSEYLHLDDGRKFDEGWHWDQTEAGMHIIIELD